MSDQEAWTADEWRLLLNAPFAAATYVSLASGGMIDFVKEMAAAHRFLCEQAPHGRYGALVDELQAALGGLSRTQAKELEFYYGSGDPQAIRAEARGIVVAAAALLARRQTAGPGAQAAEAEVAGYRQWLMAAAHTAALALTGTLLPGSGRAEIDLHEEAAIGELAAILLGSGPRS